jgi:hypothetical protein
MLIDIGITLLVISGPVICLVTALWLTARYARRVGKTTHQYTAVSLAGWLLGMIVAGVGLSIVADWLELRGAIPLAWCGVPATVAAILFGAFTGASVGRVWLRMASKRDPDYDDRPSVVPNVVEARDRGHLPPQQ